MEELYDAIRNGELQEVKKQIKLLKDADVDLNIDFKGDTPLMLAVRYDQPTIVEFLILQDEIDINAHDSSWLKQNALICATSNPQILQMLLKNKKVKVNLGDHYSDSALHYSAMFDKVQSVKILVNHEKINVNKKNKAGDTALMQAAAVSNIEILRIFAKIEAVEVNLQNKLGDTALHKSIDSEEFAGLECLLDEFKNLDMNVQNKSGKAALDLAVKRNNFNAIKLLIKHGANPYCLTVECANPEIEEFMEKAKAVKRLSDFVLYSSKYKVIDKRCHFIRFFGVDRNGDPRVKRCDLNILKIVNNFC